MDSSGKDRETNKDEEIVKRSTGRGYHIWSQGESGRLRRPHNASATSLSKSDSSTTAMTTQQNQEEKKFMLSPEAKEFIPRVYYSPSLSSAAEPNIYLPSVSINDLYFD